MTLKAYNFQPIQHNNPELAFQNAIDSGRLSVNPVSEVYVGAYMYMGTFKGFDQFKHIDTRTYLK